MRRFDARESMMAGFASIRMIRLPDLRMLMLFRFFVATGVQVGDEVIDFRCFQNVAEGWHLATTLCDLNADLSVVQGAAYSGEVRPFFPSLTADGVAVLASVIDESGCSALLRRLGNCGETRRGCQSKD
jgi:hypothetical protein